MPEASGTRVAVVVLDWNGAADTLQCVASVLQSRWAPLDVWLVDNASREPVLDEVARRHPQVRTIANPLNLGYAGGNNVGIRAALDAGADWVLVLNNDAFLVPTPPPNWAGPRRPIHDRSRRWAGRVAPRL